MEHDIFTFKILLVKTLDQLGRSKNCFLRGLHEDIDQYLNERLQKITLSQSWVKCEHSLVGP